MGEDARYPVAEVFESLQGEGYNTGMEAVFLRLGRCNLACPWCDTAHGAYDLLDEEAAVARVTALRPRNLIVTGGEPFIQEGLGALLGRFKTLGYWIGVETNGLVAPPRAWLRHIDYLAASPKALYAELYDDERMVRRADEVRIVVDGDVRAFCEAMRDRMEAARYFLAPCERGGAFNVEETVRLLGGLNRGRRRGKWLLSFQTHKLGHFR
jgi:organic radical activating enzyme